VGGCAASHSMVGGVPTTSSRCRAQEWGRRAVWAAHERTWGTRGDVVGWEVLAAGATCRRIARQDAAKED
jgi:hypothetical protein